MNKYNEQGQQHGLWEKYYRNRKLWYKGNYLNGKLDGLCEEYHGNGNLHVIYYAI